MEISKLTVSREDVIVVSDSDINQEPDPDKKIKQKTKTKRVRKVHLTTLIVNRIVPNCNRQRCTRAQYHHKITCKNTKKKAYNQLKKNHDSQVALSRQLRSPVTIETSNDEFENINSSDFNTPSSDSDEIEELIKLTRQRFKKYLGKPPAKPTTMNDYEDISSDDRELNGSIHSMDTIVLMPEENIHSPPLSLQHPDDGNFTHDHNTNMEQLSLLNNNNKLLEEEMPSPSSQDSNLLYEISGKVFMEHYLNTSII